MLNRSVGAAARSAFSMRSAVLNWLSAPSRCNSWRRAVYQVQRRNMARATPSSAGDVRPIVVRYSPAPAATVVGARSGLRCGSMPATRLSMVHTRSGESAKAKAVRDVVAAAGAAQVGERCAGQHRVRSHLQPAACVDMHGTPVHFDHPPPRRVHRRRSALSARRAGAADQCRGTRTTRRRWRSRSSSALSHLSLAYFGRQNACFGTGVRVVLRLCCHAYTVVVEHQVASAAMV
jgi:hypothetical protein